MEEPLTAGHDGEHVPAVSAPASTPAVQTTADAVLIENLKIDRKAIVDYLHGIAPEKQAIALVHALEVGVTELVARRERFKH